jgi:hypothetical protein
MNEGLIHTHEEVERKEKEILSHERKPVTILQLQMALAEELYEADHGGVRPDIETREGRNTILEYWDSLGYSLLFRNLVDGKTIIGEEPMEITLEELRRMKG